MRINIILLFTSIVILFSCEKESSKDEEPIISKPSGKYLSELIFVYDDDTSKILNFEYTEKRYIKEITSFDYTVQKITEKTTFSHNRNGEMISKKVHDSENKLISESKCTYNSDLNFMKIEIYSSDSTGTKLTSDYNVHFNTLGLPTMMYSNSGNIITKKIPLIFEHDNNGNITRYSWNNESQDGWYGDFRYDDKKNPFVDIGINYAVSRYPLSDIPGYVPNNNVIYGYFDGNWNDKHLTEYTYEVDLPIMLSWPGSSKKIYFKYIDL